MRYYLYYKKFADIASFLAKKEVVDLHAYTGFIGDNTVLHDSYVQILDLALTLKEFNTLKTKFQVEAKRELKLTRLVDFDPAGNDLKYNMPQPNPWARVKSVINVSRDEYYNEFGTHSPFAVKYSYDGMYETGHILGTKRMINSNQYFHEVVNLWERGFTGQGVKICIIDVGFSNTIPHRDIEVVDTYNAYTGDNKDNFDDQHSFQMISVAAARNKPGIPGIVGNAYNAQVYFASWNNPGASMSWGLQQGCKVFNCSFDAGTPDLYWSQAIKKVTDDGGIVIAASGNGRSATYPLNALASWPGTVSVAALVGGLNLTYQEIFYTKNVAPTNGKTLDFALPQWVVSATYDAGIAENNLYKITSGSSSAAAQLSGIYALLFERYPYLTGTDITALLKSKGKKFTDLGVTATIPKLNW